MERVNVILDAAARSAAEHLSREMGGASMSAAIRFALVQEAKRKGWAAPSAVEASS